MVEMGREIRRSVVLRGLTPILFDRYSGDNKEKLHWLDKAYSVDGVLVLPAVNIMSFLSAVNTESAPQRVVGRGYKAVCKAAQSFVQIEPLYIPFIRNGQPILANEENLKLDYAVARVKKDKLSVPNPKERPRLDLPWELHFQLRLLETSDLNEVLLKELFEKGGLMIGLGTFRGVFGKFCVAKWEKV